MFTVPTLPEFAKKLALIAQDQYDQFHQFHENSEPLKPQIEKYRTTLGVSLQGNETIWG